MPQPRAPRARVLEGYNLLCNLPFYSSLAAQLDLLSQKGWYTDSLIGIWVLPRRGRQRYFQEHPTCGYKVSAPSHQMKGSDCSCEDLLNEFSPPYLTPGTLGPGCNLAELWGEWEDEIETCAHNAHMLLAG